MKAISYETFAHSAVVQGDDIWINALGQTVSVAHDRIGPGEICIHTESLSAGEYFFSLTIGDSSYTETILVQ